ncbi:MAG: hypothetical protein KIS92_20655, partial [Planctomycetota bacterium]|nr:hypothetical protein [Planctomycetota bacterium]
FGQLDLKRLLGEDNANVNLENRPISKLKNRFQFVIYGKQDSDNVAITHISARTHTVPAKDENGRSIQSLETQVFVMVENFSGKEQDVILSLATGQTTFTPKVIKLKARARNEQGLHDDAPTGATLETNQSREVFRLPLGTTGVVTARIQSPKDSFPLDDQAQVVVGSTEGTRVLFVSKGNYFLEKAFLATRGFEVVKMTPEEFKTSWDAKGAQVTEGYDCCVFESCAPPKWDDGGAIVLAAMPPLPGFSLKDPPKLEGPPVDNWDEAHPVMRYVNFGNVTVLKAQAWSIPKSDTMLVESNGGPLIVAHESERARVVATSFEVFDSDWPLRRSMPIFLKNAIEWAAESSARRRSSAQKTGEPLVIPPMSEAGPATVTRPDGSQETVKLNLDTKTRVENTYAVGLYNVTGLPGGKDADRTFAVNLADAYESDNAAQGKIKIGEQEFDSTPSAISAKSEIWRWLAIAALALLLVEWLVYHRRLGL